VNKLLRIVLVVLTLVLLTNIPVDAAKTRIGTKQLEWSTIFDEQTNAPVWYTGWMVEPGDAFITEDNKKYEVVRADGNNAWARYVESIQISAYLPTERPFWSRLAARLPGYVAVQEQPRKIAIYHSHSDESYIPSDGTESRAEGGGGIYKVGAALASSLQAQGIQVTQSPANHNPHDDNAYDRSRRTAMTMISQLRPDAMFDVHRDAAPPEAYKANINGQDVTKVQLVVGKYNPQVKANEDFALKVKATSDQKYPGLVKGIFYAKGGDYNQDLNPRNILLEVGAHTNDRAAAERGVALMGNIIPTAVYGGGGGGGGTAAPAGAPAAAAPGVSGATKAIGWIVGIAAIGGIAFLILSSGSTKDAGAKWNQFWNTEFANLIGLKSRRKKKKDPGKEDNS